MAGTAAPPGPTERAAEGAEGRCRRVVPTPSARCGGSSPETTVPRAGRTCCRPGAATSPGFAVLLCREGAFKNWSSALLDPKHFHQARDSEVREVRLPSVSCPQHLFLSLEEQVSTSLLLDFSRMCDLRHAVPTSSRACPRQTRAQVQVRAESPSVSPGSCCILPVGPPTLAPTLGLAQVPSASPSLLPYLSERLHLLYLRSPHH